LEEITEPAAATATGLAEHLVEIETGTVEPTRRRMELLPRPVAAGTQLVIGRALGRVAQRLVGLAHRLEPVLGVGLLAHVRVVLARQAPVGRLDLGFACARFHAQDRVVILEFHPLIIPRKKAARQRYAARQPQRPVTGARAVILKSWPRALSTATTPPRCECG